MPDNLKTESDLAVFKNKQNLYRKVYYNVDLAEFL